MIDGAVDQLLVSLVLSLLLAFYVAAVLHHRLGFDVVLVVLEVSLLAVAALPVHCALVVLGIADILHRHYPASKTTA
ncbi:hypothetical protein BDB00DRAFT_815557 [Zychaea mexicana]|uniref:uncharacterized protein n=1 Tax=Zychaea mexicana TaxID=64656 RepID=UPI0022FEC1BF|nr:uncharacterized protein BDB00DRAFT_815557 [Zychaea mexicana]KAI9495034.1 hypothetical protein BDB00DRAFT_815557 [Zychaea mexicana]